MENLLTIFDYPFMRSALLAGALLGVLFALLGVFVVTRGMAFFSDFVAHSSILGGALAIMLGVDMGLFLVPYSLVVAFAVAALWGRLPLGRDTVLGVFYGGLVALGTILISIKGLGQQSLMQFLFGDILLVGWADIWFSAVLLALFLLFLRANMRKLVKATFLPDVASAEGIGVRRYDHALIGFSALAVAMSIKVVGVMLANSMVVIPAASAKAVSRSFKQFIIIAPIFGVVSFMVGLAVSFQFNLPSGPSVVAVSFCIFLLSVVAGRRIK